MSRIFDTPQEFIDWVKTQSRDVQVEISKTIELLMSNGVDSFTAAHACYEIAVFAQRVRSKANVEDIVAPDNGRVH